jgi:hypothetical protein
MGNIAELHNLHRFISATERFEFIDSTLPDERYQFLVTECVEDCVHGRNPMQRESEAANKWPPCTLLRGGSNPMVYVDQM